MMKMDFFFPTPLTQRQVKPVTLTPIHQSECTRPGQGELIHHGVGNQLAACVLEKPSSPSSK